MCQVCVSFYIYTSEMEKKKMKEDIQNTRGEETTSWYLDIGRCVWKKNISIMTGQVLSKNKPFWRL